MKMLHLFYMISAAMTAISAQPSRSNQSPCPKYDHLGSCLGLLTTKIPPEAGAVLLDKKVRTAIDAVIAAEEKDGFLARVDEIIIDFSNEEIVGDRVTVRFAHRLRAKSNAPWVVIPSDGQKCSPSRDLEVLLKLEPNGGFRVTSVNPVPLQGQCGPPK